MEANMDQIASIDKLRQSLEGVNITESYESLQELITELHFSYQSYIFAQSVPELSDQRTLWDVAFYLLTALTNSVKAQALPENEVKDGLAISGLVFELLGLWAETGDDEEMQMMCFLNAAIANTLSFYEANSTVLANRYFDPEMLHESREDFDFSIPKYGNNIVFAVLGRKFFWLQKHQSKFLSVLDEPDQIQETLENRPSADDIFVAFWQLTTLAILNFAEFMFGGNEESYDLAIQEQLYARVIARDYEILSEHWLASKLISCYEVMAERSTWRVLRVQGFSEDYIATLTRLPWNAVHELWNSQLTCLTALDTPNDDDQKNILSNEVKRAIISMPTSAGKTLIAELQIVNILEENPSANCIYVAPSRSLVDEIEIKLHRRLRFLGLNVASVIGGFELSGLEDDYLQNVDVAVLTPEKLDYLIRKRDPFISDVSLIIFDEMHKVSEGNRGWFLETLISWLMLKPELVDIKMLFMSAVLPNTQQPLIRLWIGNNDYAPVASNDWVPTRKLIGVFGYRDLDIDWKDPIEIKENGHQVYWGKSAELVFRYDIGSQFRSLTDLYKLKFWVDPEDGYSRKGSDTETRYQRCYRLVNMLGLQSSTLVYFQTKLDLTRFCGHAENNLEQIDSYQSVSQTAILEKLKTYITLRLGPESSLLDGLPYGVAFHHGDLPLDVRGEIESAYRREVIRVLACTTTLAEGVNLPVQNLIIGYPQTRHDGGYRLAVRDFKNMSGKVD